MRLSMKTIPAAMTWELLSRGRWSILAALLGAIAFPAVIFTALGIGLQAQDPAMVMLHLFLSQASTFGVAAAVFSAQGPMSRLYQYPARTSTLVAWRMIPAAAIVATVYVAVTLAINLLFHVQWPIWNMAFFLAVAFAAVQATFWLTEKSSWVVAALTVVATALGLWLKTRHGPLVGNPTRIWSDVTPGEAFTMIVAAVAAYVVAVYGVARNRRGEPPYSIGVVDRITRYFAAAPVQDRRHQSAFRAQLWHEWQRKGWVMPMVVGIGLFVGLIIWASTSRDPHELVQGLVAGGGMIALAGFLGGLVLGNSGRNDGDFAIGSFLASRPMANATLARATLVTAATSLLIAWLMWLAVFLAVLALVATFSTLPGPVIPPELGWWYFPLTILGPWIVAAPCMAAGLTGRTKLFLQLIATLAAAFVVISVISSYTMTYQGQRLVEYVMVLALGLVLILGTAWLYAKAFRRRMIYVATLIAAACFWTAACTLVVKQWPTVVGQPMLPTYALAAGLLAIAVAPFAAAPLAIAWNRHR
jgi:hypothetical protein